MTYLQLYLPWILILVVCTFTSAGIVLILRKTRGVESALRESEAQFHSTVQDQTELIVRWRSGGIRTWVNDAYCDYFQQSREALIGSSLDELFSRVTVRSNLTLLQIRLSA